MRIANLFQWLCQSKRALWRSHPLSCLPSAFFFLHSMVYPCPLINFQFKFLPFLPFVSCCYRRSHQLLRKETSKDMRKELWWSFISVIYWISLSTSPSSVHANLFSFVTQRGWFSFLDFRLANPEERAAPSATRNAEHFHSENFIDIPSGRSHESLLPTVPILRLRLGDKDSEDTF